MAIRYDRPGQEISCSGAEVTGLDLCLDLGENKSEAFSASRGLGPGFGSSSEKARSCFACE